MSLSGSFSITSVHLFPFQTQAGKMLTGTSGFYFATVANWPSTDAQLEMRLSFPGGGGGREPLGDRGQSDQLPSLHHQGDEQERRRRHRSGQEEG